MKSIFNAKNMFILSDTHFFHANIIKYCDRNYNYLDELDVLKMNEDILAEFDKLPDDKDTVIWNLGDFAFGKTFTKSENPEEVLKSIVARMKGSNRTLCYILGNHDKDMYKMIKKASGRNPTEFFYNLGFDYVYNCPIIFKENVILSHEPVYVKIGSGMKNIHGHTHNVDVTTDYFQINIENYDMKYIAAKKDKMENIPKAEFLEDRVSNSINRDDYVNVCLDANNMKILDFNEILNSLS